MINRDLSKLTDNAISNYIFGSMSDQPLTAYIFRLKLDRNHMSGDGKTYSITRSINDNNKYIPMKMEELSDINLNASRKITNAYSFESGKKQIQSANTIVISNPNTSIVAKDRVFTIKISNAISESETYENKVDSSTINRDTKTRETTISTIDTIKIPKDSNGNYVKELYMEIITVSGSILPIVKIGLSDQFARLVLEEDDLVYNSYYTKPDISIHSKTISEEINDYKKITVAPCVSIPPEYDEDAEYDDMNMVSFYHSNYSGITMVRKDLEADDEYEKAFKYLYYYDDVLIQQRIVKFNYDHETKKILNHYNRDIGNSITYTDYVNPDNNYYKIEKGSIMDLDVDACKSIPGCTEYTWHNGIKESIITESSINPNSFNRVFRDPKKDYSIIIRRNNLSDIASYSSSVFIMQNKQQQPILICINEVLHDKASKREISTYYDKANNTYVISTNISTDKARYIATDLTAVFSLSIDGKVDVDSFSSSIYKKDAFYIRSEYGIPIKLVSK